MNTPTEPKKAKRRSAASVLAQTWGWSSAEVREYEYQPGHTGGEKLYSCDQDYYCVQQRAPKYGVDDDSIVWSRYSDQGIAKQYNTVIWVGKLKPAEKKDSPKLPAPVAEPHPQTATQVGEARVPFELAAGKLAARTKHAQTLLDDINRLIAARTGAWSGNPPDQSEAAIRAINDASERLHVALVQFRLVQQRLGNY